MFNNIKTIFFDLDGTLYKMKGGSFHESVLKRYILENAVAFIALRLKKKKSEASEILNNIIKKYGESISIGLEKEFGLDRYDYFKAAWDVPANLVIYRERNLRKNLLALNKSYRLVLISDAPLVWSKNVLVELNIYDIFKDNIFSGESNVRKGFKTAFPNVIKLLKLKAAECLSVGDQEHSDILPAKELGIKTVFISQTKVSVLADYNIKTIKELTDLLLI